MTIRNDRLDDFIELWERAFGERIGRDEARTRAHQLVELCRAMADDIGHKVEEGAQRSKTIDTSVGLDA